MLISSSIILLFCLSTHIHLISSFSIHDKIFLPLDTRLLPTRTLQCNASCINCASKPFVYNTSCYIGGECYEENQTRLKGNVSCLQCQPHNIQTQWSFNSECSAGDLCFNPRFLSEHICSEIVIKNFYLNHENATIVFYNFNECGQNLKQCQPGFFLQNNTNRPFSCCPGYFCPDGQKCMIPCREGSYCPSPLEAVNGTCRTGVKCPEYKPNDYGEYGCGGSTFEGFCPADSYCPNATSSIPCPQDTKYCPTGTQKPLSCPLGFVCMDGRARRQRIIAIVISIFFVIIIVYILITILFQWLILKKKVLGEHKYVNPPGISNYFKKQHIPNDSISQFQLNIHLYQAKLRNVTRFDPKQNQGFTGQIKAGRLTALMGGSGCGKSSLLETIYGRRRLLNDGYIKFAQHEPLSNRLTDYIGYVPQADIMHNDLTVFETVYYSARTRRLNDSKKLIINDVCFVLQRLGLQHMHNSMTRTLSGGQRKRVNVAIEIVACPRVLLLDEPTSGLDTVSCDDLFDLLELIKNNRSGSVTIIMVIHQPSQELFEKIDDIFFLTPLCCLAYQGSRKEAKQHLKNKIFSSNIHECPESRHNDCDTCFIMLTKAQNHIDNHKLNIEDTTQSLKTFPWYKRVCLPFIYVISRCIRQMFIRGAIAESAYLVSYFLLGACIGYLFENAQQSTCSIEILSTIYFLISLSFGILTCISSQRLFGVEIVDKTFERESRNYFHPFQYWLAKSLVDIIRMVLYPLLFLSMLYIEIVPRGQFSYYFGIMILLSFVCSAIGQLTSVVFRKTEHAYLAGTIVALLSCLLSGFSPRKSELGRGGFIVTLSFSRHIQNLLFRHETSLYIQSNGTNPHVWSTSVEAMRQYYSFSDDENPYLWIFLIGFTLRLLTFFFLYKKSEYRSKIRFGITHIGSVLKNIISCKPCRRKRKEEEEIIRFQF
ncbi:unnamed protein product [Adineta steineri]|uniref:ABC transporter domain-containing protein n=1 Tax=Adineta steineri TaxID=433720 RepID=A0A813MF00_9BILA|nr:unnamed protein product [Adineta steineri]